MDIIDFGRSDSYELS